MKRVSKAIEKKARALAEEIAYHQEQYHTHDAPEISDAEYDALVRELEGYIQQYPELKDVGVVLLRVGGSTHEAFSKVPHRVRQWSFDNVFSDDELRAWEEKIMRMLAKSGASARGLFYVAEHKIDGLKIILEYTDGVLARASTRGDGIVGEDVTHTVRMLREIPHVIPHRVSAIIVGEAWLSRDEFVRINKDRAKNSEQLFANPRNAAAGSIRQLDPSVTQKRNVSFYAYDIDFLDVAQSPYQKLTTQFEELTLLKVLGLPTNPHAILCKNIDAVISAYHAWVSKKDDMQYGMDGMVVKVNDIAVQIALGYTAKAPRFGIAYKFPAEEVTTLIEGITLQVGRTGVVTPVAEVRPVVVSGSTVSRATLHNEDQITRLDVRIGDTVVLKKAGDVIPEIVRVRSELRPRTARRYVFPTHVDGCGDDGRIERVPGMSAYRCVVNDSDFLRRQRLYHFASKQALNIDGIGPKIIDALYERGIVTHPSDFFACTYDDFTSLPGFKELSIQNALRAIASAREVSSERLLVALSIPHVGEETARILMRHFKSFDNFLRASRADYEEIHGIGEIVADSLHAWRNDARARDELKKLRTHIKITESNAPIQTAFVGTSFVFTGTLASMSRDSAEEKARLFGGHVQNTVSAKTTYVVAGESPGSKVEKARSLGVTVLSEEQWLKLLNDALVA